MSTCMSGTNVRFTRLDAEEGAAPGAGELWSTAWRLVEIDGAAAIADAEATLEFPEQGRAAGRATCNRFFGSVTVSGDAIRFGQMGSTRMACAPEIMRAETEFFAALGRCAKVSVADGELVLLDEDGAELLRFGI